MYQYSSARSRVSHQSGCICFWTALVKAVWKVRVDQPVKPLRNLCFFPLANNSWTVITRQQIIVQTMRRVFQAGHDHTSGMNVLRNTSPHWHARAFCVWELLSGYKCSPEYLWACRCIIICPEKTKDKTKSQYSFFFGFIQPALLSSRKL